MFIQLPDSLRKVKKTIYWSDAGINVELNDGDKQPIADQDELKAMTSRSESTFFATVQQFEASVRKVEEILVNKISVAVTMGLPNMTTDRIEHALFVKQLYTSGEIDFAEYYRKLSNLFPDRMKNLPEDLKMRIEACVNIGQ